MMTYREQFKETEEAMLAALSSLEEAMAGARGGRAGHVQMLDRARISQEEALSRLRQARPTEVW